MSCSDSGAPLTLTWKYVLLAALATGAVVYLQAGLRAAAVNVHRLYAWKRFQATVRGLPGPSVVDVQVGSGSEESILRIPRTEGASYYA